MPTPVHPMGMIDKGQSIKQDAENKIAQRDDNLKKACRDFESIFVNYMMKQMRQTVNKENNVMGTSRAEEMYTSMLDSEVAKDVSKARGIGLADMMYRQMSGVVNAED